MTYFISIDAKSDGARHGGRRRRGRGCGHARPSGHGTDDAGTHHLVLSRHPPLISLSLTEPSVPADDAADDEQSTSLGTGNSDI